jgi:SAM-dependent methyltransferase
MDNAWQGERQRLAALESRYDLGTIRHLKALDVGEGWRCWEVGAGGGSIAAWLCRRAGATGHVLATDVDTRFVETISHPNLEVRSHNLVADPPPDGPFDLVHTRLLLTHLPDGQMLVRRLAGTLAPGGWLLLEEFDTVTASVPDPRLSPEQAALYHRVRDAFLAYTAARRGDDGTAIGRSLCGWLLDAGLTEVGGEGRVFMNLGGSDRSHPLLHQPQSAPPC